MPKDEFDFEDPFELNGMAFLSHEDTTNDMAECFTEEFMRMGYSHLQVLALFRNPHYLGPNMAFEKRGEPFIRDLIADVFARWGKVVTWPDPGRLLPAVEEAFQPRRNSAASEPFRETSLVPSPSRRESQRPRSGRQHAALHGRQETPHRPDRRTDSRIHRLTATFNI
jgi:hypothetical protein